MTDWKSRISTLLVASVATLLIWTWAADHTREVRALTGKVLLRPGDPSRQFVDPAQAQAVTVTVKGSPATLNRLQALLEQGLPLAVQAAGANEPSQRTVELTALVEANTDVAMTDASLVSVRPERVEVRTGAMVPVRMPVVAAASLALLKGDGEVEPAEVQALLPEPAAEAASRARAEAVIDAKGLPEGSTQEISAPLRLPDSLKVPPTQVVFTPDRVKVRFTVASRSRTFTLPTVRVEIAGAPEDLKGFDVSFGQKGDLLRDVVLSAPGDALAPIESGQARVVAVVHLTPEELSRRITQKAVSAWVLPPGVQVESVEQGQRPLEVMVPLKIEPKASAPSAPPPEQVQAPETSRPG